MSLPGDTSAHIVRDNGLASIFDTNRFRNIPAPLSYVCVPLHADLCSVSFPHGTTLPCETFCR